MHECPHCHKPGISSFQAVAVPFSNGRVSCRHCHNTSRRHFRLFARFVPGIATLASFGVLKVIHPLGFQVFWMVFIISATYAALDDLTTFEKIEAT